MMRKALSLIIFIIVAIVAYLTIKTMRFASRQEKYEAAEELQIGGEAVNHLAGAVRIKTISHQDPQEFDSTAFYAFGKFVKETYPLVNESLDLTVINEFSMLYRWKGENISADPIILTAHLDVVPVPQEDLDSWTKPPFDGVISNGILWGRGTMDDKVSVVGILEAVELLINEGFKPARTIYLAFGHDEEIGGLMGAQSIVQHLKDLGVKPAFVLDEGYSITQGLVPGVLTGVALIGIAEKGFASLTLSAELEGGHSSMPSGENAIEVIAHAITRLQQHPMKARITPPVQKFIKYVGPEMRFQEKLVFANSSLFASVIKSIYQQSPAGRAVVQTTMAPTIFKSGVKDNVIPTSAYATINFRILPGTSTEDVMDYLSTTINDQRIKLELLDFQSEPSKVSDTENAAYKSIEKTIKQVFPNVITAPNLVIAATDGRYYGEICNNVYRFLPIKLDQNNLNAMHGINERIPVEEFHDAIRFYIQVIRNSQTMEEFK
jgi:carboxypeptidase PM20D1